MRVTGVPHAHELGARIAEWWRRVVWEEPGAGAWRIRGWVQTHLRAWETAVRSFDRDLIELRAHALTFRTLLSLVPFLAVAFSLFHAFGGLEAGEQALQRLILENLAPGSEAAVAFDHIHRFVTRISAGAIGGVGVAVLFLTVVSLLTYVEKSFNALWGVEGVRSFLSRFVTYWATITVGPVLLGLSLTMTSAAQSHALLNELDLWVPGSARLVFSLLPWGVTCAGMSLLYRIVPNTHVRWRSAVGGGLLAGTLWELGKLGFTWASARLFRYNAVYGSFGALPVFLLWLQIGWIIVLLGCKLSYALQYSRALREERVQLEVGPLGREFLALRCMIEVARAYRSGEAPPGAEALTAGSTPVLRAGQEVLHRLEEAGMILRVAGRSGGGWDSGDAGYVPARDTASITLRQIVDVFRREGATPPVLDDRDGVSALARDVLEQSEAAARGITEGTTLAEAVDRLGQKDARS